MAIERALISVFDKTGVTDFARELGSLGVEIVSTGGTGRLLREAGIRVRDISDLTGWPEMLGGRVKTLHPKVHGGILFQRGKEQDRKQAAEHGIGPIDLVVVNLYPFSATAAKAGVTPEELIENIDIGGPAMIRSAAKNFQSVGVVTDPSDYQKVLAELRDKRELTLSTRLTLARKAYARTARYDGEIATELERLAANGVVSIGAAQKLPERINISLERRQIMRYGENPHQAAALYVPAGSPVSGLAGAIQHQGKELSYNNLVDLDAAWALAEEFDRVGVAIIKHNNPCGAAEQDSLREAYVKALACDPISAFGGVLAFNRPVDGATAEEVAKLFVECIVAPGYETAAREKFAAKKNLRLLEIAIDQQKTTSCAALELKRISGGVLVQEPDKHKLDPGSLKVATKRAPTDAELRALLFAWAVCKHVKSNAIVYARDGQTVGVGAGQMSRVDAAKLGVMKAATAGLSLKGSVIASDAFFPFPDSIEVAAEAGATAVIQPGGSVRDDESIATADKLGMAMVLTGVRHFRH
ncbi:MAG TPA: bifunctional phosphoribosylaminoimidazolecarboxamide formyltransferase/IMP cyclohydrolase [Candidatus Acidoferrales bacterium]|nr:bifunctional phosphoribosylaminoimidazolecarboxamide formyltransferase/IMP cyclohydrolase [Candidatus Acidoferrales bacterium]